MEYSSSVEIIVRNLDGAVYHFANDCPEFDGNIEEGQQFISELLNDSLEFPYKVRINESPLYYQEMVNSSVEFCFREKSDTWKVTVYA